MVKGMFRLCRKISGEGCVPIVMEDQWRRVCSDCVGRSVVKGVFRLCRKISGEGCVPIV